MGYPVKAVANAMLQTAENHDSKLSPLKLQKLVYIAHGWHLALRETELVDDEFAEAWQYGPVFPSLYHEFKDVGKGFISKRATDLELSDDVDFDFYVTEPIIPEDDQFTWSLLNKVWDSYGKYSGLTLSDITHQQDTPWQKTWSKSGGRKNADISNEEIKRHYKQLTSSQQKVAA
jgi:uncharacterized phage-associated protein